MWTRFMDMCSGGSRKEKWSHIYIEAPEEEAKVIFYNRFKHSPERVTCTCCGQDYSISEDETIEEATGFERGCQYNNELQKYIEKPSTGMWSFQKYLTLDEYLSKPNVLAIPANEIKPNERIGTLPQQGYVWVD